MTDCTTSLTFSPLLPFSPRTPSAPCQTGRDTTKLESTGKRKTRDIILLVFNDINLKSQAHLTAGMLIFIIIFSIKNILFSAN